MAERCSELLRKVVLESSFLVVEVGRDVIDDEHILICLVYFYALDLELDCLAELFMLQNVLFCDKIILVRIFKYELRTQQEVPNIA